MTWFLDSISVTNPGSYYAPPLPSQFPDASHYLSPSITLQASEESTAMHSVVDPLGNFISDYHYPDGVTTIAGGNESVSIEVDTFKAPWANGGPRLEEGIHSFPLFLDPAPFTIPRQGPPSLPGQADFHPFESPFLEMPATSLEISAVPTETAVETHQYSFAVPETTQGALGTSHVPMDVATPSQTAAADNLEGANKPQQRR